MKKVDLPKIIPVFPLSNFIIFPHTTVPLNIFEPRYLEMINDSMKNSKLIGIIQPKKIRNNSEPEIYDVGCQGHTPPKQNKANSISDLHHVGCVGRIKKCENTSDGRYLVELNGLSRFKVIKEVINNKPYRECEVSFDEFDNDINLNDEKLKNSDLELIFKNLKSLFEKKGYIINWESLERQNLSEIINALAMTSPFSLEEKQVLLESQSLESRKNKIAEILSTYNYDNFNNTTIQ
tara:strand:- start:536 stop:1243 length:708 start_codon:yes stop_codon:yes gene_type:complete